MAGGPELVKIIESMAREKAIDKEILFEGLEVAMVAAARKKYDEAEELVITIDRVSGDIRGYEDGREIDTGLLGRIAAQTAKQVMIQRIREAEQDVVYDEFIGRKGTLVTGSIQRFEGDNVIVDINKTESILPRHERVRTETYHVGDRIRAVISDVKKVGHRVRIVLSRTHPDLIRRLFELEIPEIADHIIEIKSLAREPGFRTKLAVVSYDSKVDCVGACVGIRGSRIRNIIDELNGEKIDIIRWNDSPEVLIMNALKPAEILSITLDDDTHEAVVQVAEDQLSLAIGKRGQNVRLAARLTGWDVNIVGAGGEPTDSQRRAEAAEGAGGPLTDAEKKLLTQLRSDGEGAAPQTEDKAAPAASAEDGEAAPEEAAPEQEAAAEAPDERDPLLEMARQAAGPGAGDEQSRAEGGEPSDPLARAAASLISREIAIDETAGGASDKEADAEVEAAQDVEETAESPEKGDPAS